MLVSVFLSSASRVQGVGGVPGQGRGHAHLHPLLKLLVAVGLPELSNDLEEREKSKHFKNEVGYYLLIGEFRPI